MVEYLNSLSLLNLMAATGSDVTDPLYEGISLVGPYAISVVLVLSLFYGVFLGVKYAKCEDASQKANMQKTLVNFVIGAVTILILLCVLYAIRKPLTDWINSDN